LTDLLKPQRIEVFGEGVSLVVIKIGNSEIKMPYEDALRFSQIVRSTAKEVKRLAGDTSRHWSIVGNLTAIEAGESPWAKRQF